MQFVSIRCGLFSEQETVNKFNWRGSSSPNREMIIVQNGLKYNATKHKPISLLHYNWVKHSLSSRKFTSIYCEIIKKKKYRKD